MSRKHEQQKRINQGIADFLESDEAIRYLAGKLIRRKPKLMPRFVWRCFLFVVMEPGTRKKPIQNGED